LQQSFREVRLTLWRAEAVWQGFDPLQHDHPHLLSETARRLHVLAAELPSGHDFASSDSQWHALWHKILWAATIACAITAVMMGVYPPLRWLDLWSAALAAYVIVYPAFAFIAGFLLSGSSTSHDRWGRLVAVGAVLIGLGTLGSVAGINGLADHAPDDDRSVTVINKRISRGRRNSKTHYATVSAWDRPGDTLDFRVSEHEYERIVPGKSQLDLTLGPGRLGIPWVKAKQVRP
jgi:hypothetical protein